MKIKFKLPIVILFAITLCLSFSLTNFAGEPVFSADFARNQWNQEDWILVKSPRWDYIGGWIQEDEYIENITPEGTDPDRRIGSPHAYVSMVLDQQFSIDEPFSVTARMDFSYDQGPQIVLAGPLGSNEHGYPEYREHFEIVLFARGVNIWHHTYEQGRPGWANVAYSRFPLQAKTPYDLKVSIESPRIRRGDQPLDGKMVVVSVDGENIFAYHEPNLPEELYVGIIGYGSINRFWNFKVERP